MKITINPTDITQFITDIDVKFNDDNNMKRFYSGVAKILLNEQLRNMDSEGSSLGKRWSPLAPSTVENRFRKGKWPGKMLQVSGELKTRNVTASDSTKAEVNNNTPYAKFLFYGTKNMPARPWLGLNEETENRIITLYSKLLNEVLNK